MKNETLYGVDDNLIKREVGSYAESKYALIRLYCRLFSTGMKNKWPIRTYVDLYAGSGYAQVKNTGRVFLGSPLIALSVDDPFDHYVFCEEHVESFRALETRVRRDFPTASITLIKWRLQLQNR